MRFVLPVAALALLAVPALAQTTTAPVATAPATTAPASPAPATPAPVTTGSTTPAAPAAPAAPKKLAGHHTTLAQRFAAANTTHDGHLTKDQATAAKWTYVTKNFSAIDSGKKGYVTADDIHAYAKTTHAMHKKPAAPAAAPAPTNS
jgi:hypothetical protein